jgi:predicted transcriptional regulator
MYIYTARGSPTYLMPTLLFPALASIKKRRLLLGLTQSRFASMCQVSQSLVAKVEAGTVEPSYRVAVSIFEALDRLEAKNIDDSRQELTAGQIMTERVISADPSADMLEKVAEKMVANNISQVPVVDSLGQAVGALTERILLLKTKGARAGDAMGEPFPIVNESTRLSVVRNILLLDEPAVLVYDKKRRLAGIITKHDLIVKELGLKTSATTRRA